MKNRVDIQIGWRSGSDFPRPASARNNAGWVWVKVPDRGLSKSLVLTGAFSRLANQSLRRQHRRLTVRRISGEMELVLKGTSVPADMTAQTRDRPRALSLSAAACRSAGGLVMTAPFVLRPLIS